jgi:hypothetical protein
MTIRTINAVFTLVTLLVAAHSAYAAPVAEITDNAFAYAFQYPSDWTLKKAPEKGKGDRVRVLVQSPGGATVMTIVGNMDTAIARNQFDRSPNKQATIQKMLDLTVDAVYRKTARDIGAKEMVVQKKEYRPSEVGIRIYISTLLKLNGGRAVALSGSSVIPFGKRYMVSFIMVAPLTQNVHKEAPTLTRVFNSFHMLGEHPFRE